MKIQFVVLALSILFYSSTGLTQATRLNASEDYLDTWAIAFGGAYTSTVLKHNETSAAAQYSSTNRRVRVDDIRMSLSLMKEFLNPKTFSVTAQILGGITDSKGSTGDNNQARFEEYLRSTHFGGGLSFNYNIYSFGLKLQPFVGVDFISEQGDLIMNHSNGVQTLNTIHRFDTQLAFLNVGIRAFDADYNLMSYFQLSAPQIVGESIAPLGRINGADIEITSLTTIDRSPVAFSMGFGYYF